MNTRDHSTVSNPEEDRPQLLHPADPKTVFLGGLFFLALFAAVYVAREIVLPIVLAMMLKLLLQPAVRGLNRLYLPRPIAAVVSIAVLFAVFFGFGAMISGPASTWAEKLPQGLPRLEQHLSFVTDKLQATRQALEKAEQATESPDDGANVVKVKGPGLADALVQSTRIALATLLTTIILLFFLLISGETFLRRIVEVLPRFSDKRQAVEIAQQVEHDMSIYLVTISAMNAAVGTATGCMAWLVGLGDPLLWGSIAFLLNYILFLGPLMGVVLFFFVGTITFDTLTLAALPAALYFLIHIAEGELITPMLLARRFTLNPVLVILSLVFWYWMWSVPGAILAVPILAVTKIVCDRIRPLAVFGHFLEG
ncbi:MAG: AI-2E family transporter [Gemmatimonas sp.]